MERPYDVTMPSDVYPGDEGTTEARPSRSQKKREALALQDMGVQLLALPRARLQQMELPEELIEAIIAARGIHKHGARKRQMQYIGKLMRQLDADLLSATLQVLKAERMV